MSFILRSGSHWDKVSELSIRKGWVWSEKLDGHRAFWDGGITLGSRVGEIPFANLAKGDARGKKSGQRSTGVWSKYCNRIDVPGTVIDELYLLTDKLVQERAAMLGWRSLDVQRPMLDLEIWCGRGPQGLSLVKGVCGVDSWEDKKDVWFGTAQLDSSGGLDSLDSPSSLDSPNGLNSLDSPSNFDYATQVVIHDLIPPISFVTARKGGHGSAIHEGVRDWMLRRSGSGQATGEWDMRYSDRRGILERCLDRTLILGRGIVGVDSSKVRSVCLVESRFGSGDFSNPMPWVEDYNTVISSSGEGLMFQKSDGLWRPVRDSGLVKMKTLWDDEMLVKDVNKSTDGQFAGGIGALVGEWIGSDGKARRILVGTGLTKEERMGDPAQWIGKVVTFAYMGLTQDGMPREPRLVRLREEE